MLSLVLALFALLMQVNAPVARAASVSPLGAICHDTLGGQSERRAPTPRDEHCAACLVCCAAPAVALPCGGVDIPAPARAAAVVARPELAARSIRGPPHRRPHARGPPAILA